MTPGCLNSAARAWKLSRSERVSSPQFDTPMEVWMQRLRTSSRTSSEYSLEAKRLPFLLGRTNIGEPIEEIREILSFFKCIHHRKTFLKSATFGVRELAPTLMSP